MFSKQNELIFFLFQLLNLFQTCVEGLRGVRVTRVFPVGESIGVDYEVILPQESSVTAEDVNVCFADKTGLDGFLGGTSLRLKASPGKTSIELSKHGESITNFYSTLRMNVMSLDIRDFAFFVFERT